ncbi:MAG: CoA-binding protein [Bacteroidota bacterium]|nr:CoA-binding protein [Bacteroidota bacterium]
MKTLVLGASTNPSRYSNRAINLLRAHKHEVVAVGLDEGKVGDVKILHDFPNEEIDTVTMYLNPERQHGYYDKIINAKPRRIIFNPGAENPELEKLAAQNNILTEEACTLVLLNTGQY